MIIKYLLIFIFLCVIIPIESLAKAKTYGKKKEYTRQQQIHRGDKVLKKYTTCRLMFQKTFNGGLACIYKGAQKTYEMEFTDTIIGCPKQYQCVYNPNSKKPNIDDVMKSLRSIVKNKK